MTEPLESDHEKAFVKYADRCGCEALKLRIDGQDGFPDRTVITVKGTFFLEFKRTRSDKLRAQQRAWFARLDRLNQYVFIAHSFQEAKDILDVWLGGKQ